MSDHRKNSSNKAEPKRRAKIRLYVEQDLGANKLVVLEKDQAHYLFGVMRLSVGDAVVLFNGRDGEWQTEVRTAAKRAGELACKEQTRAQTSPPDLELLFAPVKKNRTDFIVEKAAELGVARIRPVLTRYTNAERVRLDRMQAHVIEAAEQCNRIELAEVAEPIKLDQLFANWDETRRIMFCDERMEAATATQALEEVGKSEAGWSILIGPEGGFSDEEVASLRAKSYVTSVTLGPRVLRADTAAVAALTLWQSVLGDWKD